MRSLLDETIWARATTERKRQRFLGRISGFFLAIALIALFDGLIAQMREGSNELDMLPGNAITISGPAALKNPVSTDLIARFTPETAPLAFELEGFFTGYWFGSGMWRGRITAPPNATTGRYVLKISFRGATAQSAQTFIVKLYASTEAMREASLSCFRRWLDLNPFIVASICAGIGIILGFGTYFFGRRYARLLLELGLAQIYRSRDSDGSIWCFTQEKMAPVEGAARMVIDENGVLLGEARAGKWRKGRLHLVMMDGGAAPATALVCLLPPEISKRKHVDA